MPVYDYDCPACGPFCELQSVDHAAEPVPCPRCATAAPRAFRSMPRLSFVSDVVRAAHESNERARHAPMTVASWVETNQKRLHDQGHRHGPDCGCGGPGASATTHKTRTLVRPDGSKSFPGARPWMISH